MGSATQRREFLRGESDLVSMALALGAGQSGGPLSATEISLCQTAAGISVAREGVADVRNRIVAGEDPLGEAFSMIRSPDIRRENGATYTPAPVVRAMAEWAAAMRVPSRIIDPGVGSARFLSHAGAMFPTAELVGIDVDPLATLMARANIAVTGLSARTRIIPGDYRLFSEQVDGTTLYIGNPPYVRHHRIAGRWKDWLTEEAAKMKLNASRLAGLHVHFFLATARYARPGDFGAFITAAEWLDVNYGALVRSLILGRLGGKAVTVIAPTAQPFPDAATTAAIVTFDVGSSSPFIAFRRIEDPTLLDGPGKGYCISRDRLTTETRWSQLTRQGKKTPEDYVELGELCRVHRGTVTGANRIWIAGAHSIGVPDTVLFPTITRAREVLEAGGLLEDSAHLRCVIDLPTDLDELEMTERRAVAKFLERAHAMGACESYVARHRKTWWSVGLRAAAPIVATYMARRPPGFIRNKAGARLINIAHGLYPREPLSETAQKTLVSYLRDNVSQESGRTYAGGLTKFEPGEMERLMVPGPILLAAGAVL